jgi:hypothetical protein
LPILVAIRSARCSGTGHAPDHAERTLAIGKCDYTHACSPRISPTRHRTRRRNAALHARSHRGAGPDPTPFLIDTARRRTGA